MKVLIPVSLFLFGIISVALPLAIVAIKNPTGPITLLGYICVLTPLLAGAIMIGFGIFFALKSYSDKGD